jgi:electron transfer flavoprotein alpha subunit
MTTKNSNPKNTIFVIAEVQDRSVHSSTLELIGKAAELALPREAEVAAVVIGKDLTTPLEELFCYGAERVISVDHESLISFDPEVWTKILAHITREEKPEIILAPATTTGRTVLPALAAKLQTGLTADCTGLDIEEDTGLLLQTRPAIGGNVIATIKTPNHKPQMATVRPKNFPLPEYRKRHGKVEHPGLPDSVFESRIRNLSLEKQKGSGKNIQDYNVVISGGKGLRKPENFDLLTELADLVEGAVGASRAAVEAKWIDYPSQVGLSGKVVSPAIYVAVGISGAVQHLAGMQTSETIIAINKDPEAPINRVADIAICGDLFEILPLLTERIRQERKEKRHD